MLNAQILLICILTFVYILIIDTELQVHVLSNFPHFIYHLLETYLIVYCYSCTSVKDNLFINNNFALNLLCGQIMFIFEHSLVLLNKSWLMSGFFFL